LETLNLCEQLEANGIVRKSGTMVPGASGKTAEEKAKSAK
jgi:hypothetical protein